MLFNVENHITFGDESFDSVGDENDRTSCDIASDRMLDLIVFADISYNFAVEFSELSPEHVMSDDGIAMRTQLNKFQHEDPSLTTLFDLAKAEHKDTSASFLVFTKFVMMFDVLETEYHHLVSRSRK